MLKISDNPPIRPPGRQSLIEFGCDWYVAHTKSRNEKLLAFDLLAKGVDYFLPLVPKTIFSGGRKRKVLLPLFGGYLFFNGTREQRLAVLQTDRTCNVIEVRQSARLVESLRAIELALDNNVPIDAYPFAVVGRRVRVIAGPMTGVVGTIARRDEVERLYIGVEMLGQAVEIQVETSLVQPFEVD